MATTQKRHRRSRNLHRWSGMILLLPLLVATITGILLNHTIDLKLNERFASHPWILSRYGMELKGTPNAYGLDEITYAAHWDGHLFVKDKLIPSPSKLVAAVPLRDGIAVVSENLIHYFGLDGELIETLDSVTIPSTPIKRAGRDSNLRLVIEIASAQWTSDAELLNFQSTPPVETVSWSTPTQPSEPQITQWKRSYSGEGIPHDRIILDIHSGRFFGAFGKWVWDLLTIGVLILSATGLILFFRNRKRKT